MESNNNTIHTNNDFNEIFNCDKMKSLIAETNALSFSDRFRNWLKVYTKESREKIWVDIESYRAG
jgi:hypothetical protein